MVRKYLFNHPRLSLCLHILTLTSYPIVISFQRAAVPWIAAIERCRPCCSGFGAVLECNLFNRT